MTMPCVPLKRVAHIILLSIFATTALHAADNVDIKVVFHSVSPTDIYSINGDGSGFINLTNRPASNDRNPHWSPDGSKIVFESDREGFYKIYTMNSDGSQQTRVTAAGGVHRSPRWSPDGTRIAFVSARDEGNNEIYVINADGTNEIRLTRDTDDDSDPNWSPDGTRIAYTANVGGNLDIRIVATDGSGQIGDISNATPTQELQPAWSPDGSYLIGTTTAGGDLEIFRADADGSNVVNLTDHPSADNFPSFSPDGTRIVFDSDRGGQTDVYTMNPDGSGLINVTNSAASQSRAVWSRGGSKLIVRRSGGGMVALEIFDPQGGSGVEFTASTGLTSMISYDAFEDFVLTSEGGTILANLAPKITAISPLSIFSVFGLNFTQETILFPNLDIQGRIAKNLGGACFEVNGERTPIYAVTPKQANLQSPATMNVGPVSIVAIRNCDTTEEVRSEARMVTSAEATPAFFLYPPVVDNGLIAARFNSDNVAVAPAGMFTDQFGSSRPAQRGDIIVLYGTGWGPTEANLGTGQLATTAASVLPAANVLVTFGGIPLAPEDIFYVGVTPQAAGLYQLAIRVPANAQSGNNQVVLRVYGKSTPTGPVIPVVVNVKE